MSDDRPYQPIDCSLHDRLESAATLRKAVPITYRTANGDLASTRERIDDIVARDGVEYLTLERSGEIRLDDLDSVDGVLFRIPPTGD